METHKTYTAAEVAEHNNSKSCWMIIAGKVYAVERFLSEHPGGEDVLLETAGRDATREFEDVGHSKSAREQLNEFFIGDLVEEAAQSGEKRAGGGARDGVATSNGAAGEEFGGAFGRVPAAASASSGGVTLVLKRVTVPVLIALLVYLRALRESFTSANCARSPARPCNTATRITARIASPRPPASVPPDCASSPPERLVGRFSLAAAVVLRPSTTASHREFAVSATGGAISDIDAGGTAGGGVCRRWRGHGGGVGAGTAAAAGRRRSVASGAVPVVAPRTVVGVRCGVDPSRLPGVQKRLCVVSLHEPSGVSEPGGGGVHRVGGEGDGRGDRGGRRSKRRG
eukprot:ctg_2884.g365